MAQSMTQTEESETVISSPVDDATYNLLQALTSKLEALEAYEVYQEDDETGTFSRLLEDDREHARMLLEALRDRLASA
jgi:nitrate reductase NapAB chaperone NapD